ncbi:penicillin-binding protein 2 [Serpentinicella sp. ANB-PHB4]|uniref:peptidoglycan D,D-transpeptidase FtsI family protein n=1 Tax=Serpentinicella sp. ANB-PHB4 TaxID=3074076 RepID=UPI002860B7FD|nr:penicillin-binding protein 2 [Serpentinicella sp. ANB-PHB4]MDR5658112.1 penicillin-binding protein 2 [Serpentinicella sp. ANB-PHB4]
MRKERKEKERKMNTTKNRLKSIGYISSALLLLLVMRLFYLQVIMHDYYSHMADNQSGYKINIDCGRGNILDRNYKQLTNKTNERKIIVDRRIFNASEENLNTLMQFSPREEVQSLTNSVRATQELTLLDPTVNWNDPKIIAMRGVFVVDKFIRYDSDQLAPHLLGYLHNDTQEGITGVEASFNHILMGAPYKQRFTLDGKKRIVPSQGSVMVHNEEIRKNLRLTIDHSIQEIAEEALEKENHNGAVVISDVTTGEILALASTPKFNPNKTNQYNNRELINKATSPYSPASIFKIILAIEALEQNLVTLDQVFYCKGVEDGFGCMAHDHEDGEVALTFKEAFASSCNSTFIQLGKQIGGKKIKQRAKSLGLGDFELDGLVKISSALPTGDHLLGRAIGNISMGQGQVETTPVQVNQLIQIIANNGVKKPLYITKDIVDDENNLLEVLAISQQEERVLTSETTNKIQEMMQSVTKEGTGTRVEELGEVTAGKTGTAQRGGNQENNAWFAGYYPIDNPKYAITVFIEAGQSGSRVAVPVFKEIVEKLIQLEF